MDMEKAAVVEASQGRLILPSVLARPGMPLCERPATSRWRTTVDTSRLFNQIQFGFLFLFS